MCTPVPITAANLGRYAAYLADFKQLSPCSILKYMNIIRLLHLEAGSSNPLIDCWILDSVIRGIKRCNGKELDRKLLITPHILARMHYLINKDSPFDVVFWAICLVLFFGMLRKSNVLCPSLAFNPSKHLCRSDFFVHPWGLEIKIRWSKTIQFRDRCLSVPLPFLPGNKLCPATAVITPSNCAHLHLPVARHLFIQHSRFQWPLNMRRSWNIFGASLTGWGYLPAGSPHIVSVVGARLSPYSAAYRHMWLCSWGTGTPMPTKYILMSRSSLKLPVSKPWERQFDPVPPFGNYMCPGCKHNPSSTW